MTMAYTTLARPVVSMMPWAHRPPHRLQPSGWVELKIPLVAKVAAVLVEAHGTLCTQYVIDGTCLYYEVMAVVS